jgi:hypothetical protein
VLNFFPACHSHYWPNILNSVLDIKMVASLIWQNKGSYLVFHTNITLVGWYSCCWNFLAVHQAVSLTEWPLMWHAVSPWHTQLGTWPAEFTNQTTLLFVQLLIIIVMFALSFLCQVFFALEKQVSICLFLPDYLNQTFFLVMGHSCYWWLVHGLHM